MADRRTNQLGAAGALADADIWHVVQGGLDKQSTLSALKTYIGAAFLALGGGTMTGALVLAGAPTVDLHPATKKYVDDLISELRGKTSVKAASIANVNITVAPASLDGVSGVSLDRWLLKDQTAPAENGIYRFNGTGNPLTRVSDFDSWTEIPSAFVMVEQGTVNANTGWLCTADQGGTLGTTAVTWEFVIGGRTAIASIASAATTDLGAVPQQSISVTGTTPITSLGSSAPTGTVKFVTFAGALVLTHNSTSLILPGAVDINVVAGEGGTFRHEGSGNWICLGWKTSPAPGRNYLENSAFDVWQAGTSFALASGTATFLADRWKARRAAAGSTISRQAGFSGARYCMRIQRDAADSSTVAVNWYQQVESALTYPLAGRSVIVSFDARMGADYSAAAGALSVSLRTGTGVDEALNMTNGTFATGNVNGGNLFAGALSTSAQRIVCIPYLLPSDATEMVLRFAFTPVGTAGAADYVEITNLKIEPGPFATPYEKTAPAETLDRCLRHYRKSFLQATTPAQNAGAATGEHRFPATVAGANANRLGSIRFGSPMRATPTITLFNPAAANAQVRDLTAAADCSAAASANVSDSGFEVTCTANAATAVGNDLGAHWTADARL